MPETTDTPDFFRPRLAEMIDLRHPLAVLASRLTTMRDAVPISSAEASRITSPAEASSAMIGSGATAGWSSALTPGTSAADAWSCTTIARRRSPPLGSGSSRRVFF